MGAVCDPIGDAGLAGGDDRRSREVLHAERGGAELDRGGATRRRRDVRAEEAAELGAEEDGREDEDGGDRDGEEADTR